MTAAVLCALFSLNFNSSNLYIMLVDMFEKMKQTICNAFPVKIPK